MGNKTMLVVILRNQTIAKFNTQTIESMKHLRSIGADVTLMVDSFDYSNIKKQLTEAGEPSIPVRISMWDEFADERSIAQLLCSTTMNPRYTHFYATEIGFLSLNDLTGGTFNALNSESSERIIQVNETDNIFVGGSINVLRLVLTKPDKKLFNVYKPRTKKTNTISAYISSIFTRSNDEK